MVFSHFPLGVTGNLFFDEFLPFIGMAFSLCQGDFDFCQSACEVNSQWDECESFLVKFDLDLFEFAPVDQEFSGSKRFMIHDISMLVSADMAPEQKEFAASKAGEGLLQVRIALPETFDFGAYQGDASLELFQQVVFISGFFVLDRWGKLSSLRL